MSDKPTAAEKKAAEELAKKEAAEKKAAEELAKKKVALKFKAPYKRYANGDIAGFSADTAEQILKLKPAVAEKYKLIED